MLHIENAHRKLRLLSRELAELRVRRIVGGILNETKVEEDELDPIPIENRQKEDLSIIKSNTSHVNESFIENNEQNVEESIILEHNNCDVTEYNDILVVNTKINEKIFNEEIYVEENSDTIQEESLDLTISEHGVTRSSSIISENLLFKKDTNIESDGNLIGEELQDLWDDE